MDWLKDGLLISTGEANKEAPHITVPFYMPLAEDMPIKDALKCLRPALAKQVRKGKIELIAIANGNMGDGPNERRPCQFILFWDNEDGEPGYYLFSTIDGDLELAVLMNGDGTRYMSNKKLPPKEAVALWMGGFLGWNEKDPGLYRLRYALIAG